MSAPDMKPAIIFAALAMTVMPAYAQAKCVSLGDGGVPITWRGEIVESTFMNGRFDGTERTSPQKYMAIVPDEPQCSKGESGEQTPERIIVLIWPGITFKGPPKWLGHYVEIRGFADLRPSDHYPTEIVVNVESIKDAP
jgi:hypothetical protein